jgi:nucleoside-diphosphate-sugar epimerase
MELLLTGSTGFVGRNLLIRLVSDPRWRRILLPVRDPEKLLSQLAEEGISDARLVPCRVSDDLWQLPPDAAPDVAIHAAGLLFGRRREDYFKTNVDGSLRLAAQLPRTCRMVLLSSLAAGGPTPAGEKGRTIDHEDRPVSWYGASKLTLERELRNRLRHRLLILRPPMVLGPRDTATVPLFQMARGSVRIKPGFAPKHYSWIAVGALCEAILAASADPSASESHGPFYLGAEETITDTDLIAASAEVLGSKGVLLPVPQTLIRMASFAVDAVPSWRAAAPSLGIDRVREILPDRWVCDSTPFRRVFGWNQSKGLRETLSETAAWLETQGKI